MRRRLARRSLIGFTEYTNSRYRTAELHRMLAEGLDKIRWKLQEADSTSKPARIMIHCPPRFGKSELASRRFPAWVLGELPHSHVMSFASTSTLASEFGRDVRDIVAGGEFNRLYPSIKLAEDSQAKGRWHTNAGGSYYSAGVGTRILGRGFNLGIFDDLFGSMEDAKSPVMRENIWNWFMGTAYNRREPGAAMVVINHRLNDDDVSARLLANQAAGGDQWDVIELPALDANDETTCPERFSTQELHRTRANMVATGKESEWSALYMQDPTVPDGDYFKREWFRWYDDLPRDLEFYGATDFAVTKDGGDHTVHVIAGVDGQLNLYIVEVWRERVSSDVAVETMIEMAEDYDPLFWAIDNDIITKSLGPFIDQRMQEREIFVPIEGFVLGRNDKRFRAQSFRARAGLGKVYLPRNAAENEWIGPYLRELLAFDNGRYDDQVDASGLLGRLLDRVVGGVLEAEPEPDRSDSYEWPDSPMSDEDMALT